MKLISNAIKKAVIEMLLLYLLSQKDMYGYELVQTLKTNSDGKFTLMEGSMYPILYRLADQGDISCYEKLVGRRQKRVYYHLEEPGKKHLEEMKQEYTDYIALIDMLMHITF